MKKFRFGRIFKRCNLCDRLFRASSQFHQSCRTCRDEVEMLQFFEWLNAKV